MYDEDVHWIDTEYQRYLDRGDFCHCNLPDHKCECEHLTLLEFQEIELRRLEEYYCTYDEDLLEKLARA